jgi:sugar-specific transcriptional regulator TrmB
MLKFSDNFRILEAMQIPELAAKLEPLGLSDKEARVYVAALFLGPSPVQKIASQAEINRATAYVILDQLAELGLVSQSQEGKKTVFIAEPPEALERLFDHQQALITERKDRLEQLLPDLQLSQHGQAPTAPTVRFYRGMEGISASSRDLRRSARVGSIIYAMSDYDEVIRMVPDVLQTNPVARLRKRLSSQVIYSFTQGTVPSDPKLLRTTRKVATPIKADVLLYEKTAALWTYTANPKDSTGVIIEDAAIVAVLRQLFELAWRAESKKES